MAIIVAKKSKQCLPATKNTGVNFSRLAAATYKAATRRSRCGKEDGGGMLTIQCSTVNKQFGIHNVNRL